MGTIMEYFRQRRSIRQYSGQDIDEAVLRQVLEAGLTAPTGDNFQTVDFVLIRNREMLADLARTRRVGAKMLEKAGAAVLVLADAEKSDLWIEDAAIATAYMHLAADALGLGSCWIQMRARDDAQGGDMEDALRERFGFPARMRPLAILALGRIDAHPAGHGPESARWEKLHEERW